MSTLTTTAAPDEVEVKRDKRRKHLHIADVSKMRLSRPDVIGPIIHMLGLRRPIHEISKVCRVSNGTVLEVLNDPEHGPKIQEQRAHFATQVRNALRLGIEATVKKYAEPKAKAPPVFDLRMLYEIATLEEGGATQRVEVVHTLLSPDRSATIRLLEAGQVSVTSPEEMGSHGQKVHALPASTAQPADPDEVRESEETAPNSIDHV